MPYLKTEACAGEAAEESGVAASRSECQFALAVAMTFDI
jgi:hypothetical protein